jgi:predicted Ser/Thr protein kinase
MIDRNKYLLAKANGIADRFRGDEISRRIADEYPLNAQVALDMNLMKDLLTGTREHYAEWEIYEAFRQKVKDEVDAEIAEIEGG